MFGKIAAFELRYQLRQPIFWIAGLIFFLLVVYVVNGFTPLRLTFDTVRYFKIKEWIEAGRPPGAEAAADFLPAGYVWFLYLLEKMRICISPVISLGLPPDGPISP